MMNPVCAICLTLMFSFLAQAQDPIEESDRRYRGNHYRVGGSKLLSMFAGGSTVGSTLSVIMAFGFSGLVGTFFGFRPADKASPLNPIDALRYE
jgi:ABC-type antimicrobial peptide transport system permease subunit